MEIIMKKEYCNSHKSKKNNSAEKFIMDVAQILQNDSYLIAEIPRLHNYYMVDKYDYFENTNKLEERFRVIEKETLRLIKQGDVFTPKATDSLRENISKARKMFRNGRK
jgi:hypothetical protein